MKWGVRRQAKVAERDERYRKKQAIKTAKYYDKSRFSGLRKVDGITSLQKKINNTDDRYKKSELEQQLRMQETLKKAELTKVSSLTHDQIQRERIAVGKSVAKDVLLSIGTTAIIMPTTGLVYIQGSNIQEVRSKTRLDS